MGEWDPHINCLLKLYLEKCAIRHLGKSANGKGNCTLTLNEERALIPKVNFPKVSKKLVRGEIEEYSKRILRSFRIFS
jgi:hypothetical protein